MANKSAEYPQGSLGRATLLSFLGRARDGPDTFTEMLYQERIPDNWYKRNLLDEYSVPFIAADIVTVAALGGFSNPGGDNPLGKLPVGKISGGAYTSEDMRDPALRLCFLTQSVSFMLPAMWAHSSSSVLGGLTKEVIGSVVRDFEGGTEPLPCQGRAIKRMDLKLVGKLLEIRL